MRRKGLALLIVLGILGVLAVLGVSFVTIARLERKASQQRLWGTRALLLARSGIEDALARLASGQDPDAQECRYRGEDLDGSGALDGPEPDAERFRPGHLDTESCPLDLTLVPSFAVRSGGSGTLRLIDGRPRGCSGALQGDLGPSGNQYGLKILGGGFYVNGGNPEVDVWRSSYADTLRRMLGDLAQALDLEDGSEDGLPVGRGDGEALIHSRPLGGWTSWEGISTLLGPEKFAVLRPYLCLSAWVDRHVIRPNPGWGWAYNSRPDASLNRTLPGGRPDPGARGEIDAIDFAPDFERVYDWGAVPQRLGPNEGRAPVELAWARRRRPALLALLSNLRGNWLDEGVGTVYANGDLYAQRREASLDNAWSGSDECHLVAAQLMACPDPLDTWQAFHAFCDGLPLSGGEEALPEARLEMNRQAKRDLIKANFNPNSDLNRFNPDAVLWKLVDKSDLTQYSTEFSLFPVQEREISSLGRVLDASGRILASRTVTVTVPAPSVVRLSTQRELAAGDLGSLDEAGDERGTRLPGFVLDGRDAFLSESRSPLAPERTWGHRLDVQGLYPGTWMDGDSGGASLQTYPEPCVSPRGPLFQRPADYDGSLRLATTETPEGATYGAPGGNPTCLARFDDAFDLDFALGDASCHPDVEQATRKPDGTADLRELKLGLLRAPRWTGRLGTLYPDGAYSCRGRAPAFAGLANARPSRGLMSFWVKDDAHLLPWSRGRMYLGGTGFGPLATPADPTLDTQWFSILHVPDTGTLGVDVASPGQLAYWAMFDADHSETAFYENLYRVLPEEDSGPRWHLVTFAWDTGSESGGSAVGVAHGVLLLDEGSTVQDRRSRFEQEYLYNVGDEYTGWITDDWTASGAYGPHLMTLGPWERHLYQPDTGWNVGGGADATFDEFALWDYGPDACGHDGPAPALAATRWREGRYYRQDAWPERGLEEADASSRRAAQYLSAPIRLPVGSRIQGIHWTWLNPKALPGDFAEVALTRASPSPGGWEYLWGDRLSRSVRAPGWAAELQCWDCGRAASGPFRIQAVFRRTVPLADDVPVLESPVLDDLSVVYRTCGAPLSAWTQE